MLKVLDITGSCMGFKSDPTEYPPWEDIKLGGDMHKVVEKMNEWPKVMSAAIDLWSKTRVNVKAIDLTILDTFTDDERRLYGDLHTLLESSRLRKSGKWLKTVELFQNVAWELRYQIWEYEDQWNTEDGYLYHLHHLIGDVDEIREVQDQVLRNKDQDDDEGKDANDTDPKTSTVHLVQASFHDMVAEADKKEAGCIWNAIDIPLCRPGLSIPAFNFVASNVWSWEQTRDVPQQVVSSVFPDTAISWALVSHAGSTSFPHIDAVGALTSPHCLAGRKHWFVIHKCGQPKGMPLSINDFLHDYDAGELKRDVWDVESVVLEPGTDFFMQPNCLHYVIMEEHSIFYGQHFYTSSAIQGSIVGWVNTCLLSFWVTNIEHNDMRCLLIRMMCVWTKKIQAGQRAAHLHVPLVHEREGLLNIVALGTLMIFLNALVPSEDKRGIENKLGVAAYTDLMQWIDHHWVMEDLQDSNAQYSAAHLLFCGAARHFGSALIAQNFALINDDAYQLVDVEARLDGDDFEKYVCGAFQSVFCQPLHHIKEATGLLSNPSFTVRSVHDLPADTIVIIDESDLENKQGLRKKVVPSTFVKEKVHNKDNAGSQLTLSQHTTKCKAEENLHHDDLTDIECLDAGESEMEVTVIVERSPVSLDMSKWQREIRPMSSCKEGSHMKTPCILSMIERGGGWEEGAWHIGQYTTITPKDLLPWCHETREQINDKMLVMILQLIVAQSNGRYCALDSAAFWATSSRKRGAIKMMRESGSSDFLIPVFQEPNHWVLFWASFDDKTIVCLDSLGGSKAEFKSYFTVYSNIMDEAKGEIVNWQCSVDINIPKQLDVVNCKVFVVGFAAWIVRHGKCLSKNDRVWTVPSLGTWLHWEVMHMLAHKHAENPNTPFRPSPSDLDNIMDLNL
ncbi:hypothetical protein EDD85DRAFT_958587 [Armillaria nabsnona]|nr:hypothetical protein EDD85DRAFT_958587 [Armillaria nabsnona]